MLAGCVVALAELRMAAASEGGLVPAAKEAHGLYLEAVGVLEGHYGRWHLGLAPVLGGFARVMAVLPEGGEEATGLLQRQALLLKNLIGSRNPAYVEAGEALAHQADLWGKLGSRGEFTRLAEEVRLEIDAIWEHVESSRYGMTVQRLHKANEALLAACHHGDLQACRESREGGALLGCVDEARRHPIH
jgi:hypothetical protein